MPKCNGGELFEFLANETEAPQQDRLLLLLQLLLLLLLLLLVLLLLRPRL